MTKGDDTPAQATKILVVEDERLIALDLKQRLVKLGYNVVGTAATGGAAVGKAEELLPDIVLMDIHLEGVMDGTEAALVISERLHTPVVFLTAYAEDDTLRRALSSFPFGYLLKPVETSELHAAIQTALTRHDVESKLVRSEQRLQLALNAAGMGVWEWEPDHDRFVAGGLFNKLLGTAPSSLDEKLERFIGRLLSHEQALARQALLQALEQDNGQFSGSFQYLTADDEAGWLEVHACASRDQYGARLVGVVKDVTDRHKLEEELNQSAIAFETISEGLFILDQEGGLLSVNPAFLRITGFTLEEIKGKKPEEFLYARRHSDQFFLRLAQRQGGHWEGESWCKRRDGEVFPVWEGIRAVHDQDGQLKQFVASIADISPLRRAEEKINHLAYHDSLTGLPNRLLFKDRLNRTLELGGREETLFAVMFIDLDGFKAVNDKLGHGYGDVLLQHVAARFQGALRSSDTVARLGGDEFVVIAGKIDRAETAGRLASKLLDVLNVPINLEGEKMKVSASIGIAVYPNDGKDSETLMKAADAAMYQAKDKGKNRFCFYTPELSFLAETRAEMELDLRQAIQSDQLILHYQPRFNLDNGQLIGVEALFRWRRSDLRMVYPDELLPIAEEIGVIDQIGSEVLRKACQQIKDWMDSSGQKLRLAINVSNAEIRSDQFPKMVEATLKETGFPAEWLELEVSEKNLQRVSTEELQIKQLKRLGVGITLDDFGSGFTSLPLLKKLPIDRLKIDRSIIQGLPHDSDGVSIITAMISMAQALDLGVVIAVGVENQDQVDILRRLECSEAQGYLLGRPVAWEDFMAEVSSG